MKENKTHKFLRILFIEKAFVFGWCGLLLIPLFVEMQRYVTARAFLGKKFGSSKVSAVLVVCICGFKMRG